MTDEPTELARIKSRGYWRVVARPATYDPERVPHADLPRLVDRIRVTRRGWSVPHLNTRDDLTYDDTFVGQATDWNHHQELWRIYESGQFIHINALSVDWFDESRIYDTADDWQPGQLLGVAETVFTLREYFELIARYALSCPGDDPIVTDIALHGIKNRRLYVDDPIRAGFPHDLISRSNNKFTDTRELSRADAAANANDLALDTAIRLFSRRFGWDVDRSQLRQLLDSLWDSNFA